MQVQQAPFAEKVLDGKKFSRRVHGVKINGVVGLNIIDFVVPYATAMISRVEVIGATACDTANFKILDPNEVVLNQHGYDVVLSADYYDQRSEFAGDIVSGLILRCEITLQNAGLVGVNYILTEVEIVD